MLQLLLGSAVDGPWALLGFLVPGALFVVRLVYQDRRDQRLERFARQHPKEAAEVIAAWQHRPRRLPARKRKTPGVHRA